MLVIAGVDSSGGAGLTRDLQAIGDLGGVALCAVTAVTAQTDQELRAVHVVPPRLLRAQIAAALDTRRVGAIKIGMLATAGQRRGGARQPAAARARAAGARSGAGILLRRPRSSTRRGNDCCAARCCRARLS